MYKRDVVAALCTTYRMKMPVRVAFRGAPPGVILQMLQATYPVSAATMAIIELV